MPAPEQLYRTIKLIRRFEERAIELVRAGEIVTVDVEMDPETNEEVIVFRSEEGFEPPTMEELETASTE